jgi:hypothetical protein
MCLVAGTCLRWHPSPFVCLCVWQRRRRARRAARQQIPPKCARSPFPRGCARTAHPLARAFVGIPHHLFACAFGSDDAETDELHAAAAHAPFICSSSSSESRRIEEAAACSAAGVGDAPLGPGCPHAHVPPSASAPVSTGSGDAARRRPPADISALASPYSVRERVRAHW